ncbi:hypothetical protein GZH47_25580 [Paenibacillus rhizovicinus]|uniref:Copper amine oxidase-like N-terminal domain-containing protein n=1 Tax=Paenibacillus rhizovicinus TaxID=2704463 RepID=A0A6C0P5V2_9BACL|nr:stalk domain-containing protein [Paenibacillus rhizovicinus]QHW33835.1 hypothetical protein GZH47_25580 [Paenibacillus rhizovicinus]
MKKKIILSFVVIMLLLTGVVSATSLYGKYKGYDIVRVKVDGKEVKSTSGVPAISFNGNTMVPVSMLAKAGVGVNWDANNRTVEITSPTKSAPSSGANDQQLFSSVVKYGINSIGIKYDGKSSSVTMNYNGVPSTLSDDNLTNIAAAGYHLPTKLLIINFTSGEYYAFFTSDINEWVDGKITGKQLMDRVASYIITSTTTSISNNNNANSSTNTSTNTTKTFPLLYSNDGKVYLGKLSTNKYDSDSIFNTYGTYGSKYSTTSIWNEYGTYGGSYSSDSAFNKFTSTPPEIVYQNKILGYVTTNSTISNGISPNSLYDWLANQGF